MWPNSEFFLQSDDVGLCSSCSCKNLLLACPGLNPEGMLEIAWVSRFVCEETWKEYMLNVAGDGSVYKAIN
mgnify:CR=1 FL=1